MLQRFFRSPQLLDPQDCLPGRDSYAFPVPETHAVNGHRIQPPFPQGLERAVFGMGCFWGAERKLWQVPGVWSTAVGYSGGVTPHPTYEETCTGRTNHAEVVLVLFDPALLSYEQLLTAFWENHDPTQGMRQGNDSGTVYRSTVYTHDDAQLQAARASRDAYQQALQAAGHRAEITTEIAKAREFWYAEGYHQQYLHKNPGGYCGLGGTGVSCPVGLDVGG